MSKFRDSTSMTYIQNDVREELTSLKEDCPDLVLVYFVSQAIRDAIKLERLKRQLKEANHEPRNS